MQKMNRIKWKNKLKNMRSGKQKYEIDYPFFNRSKNKETLNSNSRFCTLILITSFKRQLN